MKWLLGLMIVCLSFSRIKATGHPSWDELEEEAVEAGVQPLLGRGAVNIDLCAVPSAAKRAKTSCRRGRERRMCRALCLEGYKLPDGGSEQTLICHFDEGVYKPTERFIDCEASCDHPCQNGGRCAGGNKCICEANFRGPLCQYPASLCDGHFTDFLGTWKCSHLKNGTQCQLSCPEPFYFSFESPNIHECSIAGVWSPPQVPKCVADDPELELLPGEVTRDSMEDNSNKNAKDDDDEEYEIFETVNADKPEEESNSVMVDKQDASANIVRRKKCPEGKVKVPCASECEATCEHRDPVCPKKEEETCKEGCACADGFVLLGETCVPNKACPCYHEGYSFNSGHYIVQDCNTCTCQEGEWQCTNQVCDSECSVLVNSYYNTFDGHAYHTGAGQCAVILMQITDGPQIVQDRGSCPEDATKVCVGDLVINIGEQSVRITEGLRVLMNHREYTQLPVTFQKKILVTQPTRDFIQVNIGDIIILTNGKSQISVKASPSFFNRTLGLCGTFNHNRQDDFTTPNNDITTSALVFAEQWAVQDEKCRFTPSQDCEAAQLDYDNRHAICKNLHRESSVFEECGNKVAPEVYYEQCMEVLCSCTSESHECLCPFLSYYSQLCSNKGTNIQWIDSVQQCSVECHHGTRYQLCSSSCHSTCAQRSYFDGNCTDICVEGCACPRGSAFNSHHLCVPMEQCLCTFDGREYQDGFRQARHNEDCTCDKGLWRCEASAEEREIRPIIEVECPANEEFQQCMNPCEPTCKGVPNHAECDYQLCTPGCQCSRGYVRNQETGQCIRKRECSCVHGGVQFNEGEIIHRECNQCTCSNSAWQCTDVPCPGVCDVWGNTHIRTFDGLMLDFDGTCEYVIARSDGDQQNAGAFSIILHNFHCPANTLGCQKNVHITYEAHSLTLQRHSWVGVPESVVLFSPTRVGLFTKIVLPNEITVYWDGESRLHVIAGVQWKERVSGLCGNYNGEDSDELRATPGGPLVTSVVDFVVGWQVHSNCRHPQVKELVCDSNQRRPWAAAQCGILLGKEFEDCHDEVDVNPYHKRCMADACGCQEGGDCDCLCTAVAAYGHRCAQKGVHIRWRHQELCPIQCDEECERYTTCVPDHCKNSQTCLEVIQAGVQLNCPEPFCVEGCALPKCKPGHIRLNSSSHECVSSSYCASPEPVYCHLQDSVFQEGQRAPSNDPCISCYCIRGEIKCVGKACGEVNVVQSCFNGWSDWRSDTSPPDAFGRDAEYLVYHQCPSNMIKAVECRTVHDHQVWAPDIPHVSCSPDKGLECTPNGIEPCVDWEMRLQCECDHPPPPSPVVPAIIPKSPEDICPYGEEFDDCAIHCERTCHKFRRDLMKLGQCLNTECIPGCRKVLCQPGQVLLEKDQCLELNQCPCVMQGGEVIAAGEVKYPDECTQCQCLNNDVVCQTLKSCSGETSDSIQEKIEVLPTEGCWTSWISTDNADAAGDFENLQQLIQKGYVCQRPKAIQCQTKESHRSPGGIDWTATGQTVTCDINSGLSCFHTANERDGCYDYQVKFYCPCNEIDTTFINVITPEPSKVVVEFYCPEANGLFPDPVNCDHFYHCSNNFPFHKPCGAGTLFNPALKICDHPENVQCGQGEVLVAPFVCPVPTGMVIDPENCNWFYHCVSNVAYHKLCPSGLSFNPISATCDWANARCGAQEDIQSYVIPDIVTTPASFIDIFTSSPVRPPVPPPPPPPSPTLVCPEHPPDSALSCGTCSPDTVCDGTGVCVFPESCSCYRDGKYFPVGGMLESTTCQECSCQIGGHSSCKPLVCQTCQNGSPGVLGSNCRCVCSGSEIILVSDCPEGSSKCSNGQCLDRSRWCDGFVDCDNDEVQCTAASELIPVSDDQVMGPATCELIGNHWKTFDGQEFSYDYCHNILAKDIFNNEFQIAVNRECSSASHCEPQVIFEASGTQVRIFPLPQLVIVNGNEFTAAQLASAAPFGDIKVIIVGDIIELSFKGQDVKLAINKDQIKTIVHGRYVSSSQAIGVCGPSYRALTEISQANGAGITAADAKVFGDKWALPLSPGALCVSHTCLPHTTIEAMQICSKLSSPPLSTCTDMKTAFKDCLATTCVCLQNNRTVESCSCDAFSAFQTQCVNQHGNNVINQMTGWRQKFSCAPKCPPDQEYLDCGPSCVVTCQNFFETGQLTCASQDSGSCIPGCFCPPGLVLDFTTNTCIETESCADKVCVGYGDPQMKTFDGYSFSLGKSGEFNIASDRDGVFKVQGLNAPCMGRATCVVGLDISTSGHVVNIRRNEPALIDGQRYPEEALPWKSSTGALSVFSLQSGQVGTTVISLTRLGVQIHYSNENAAFSIHVPSKKFFDKMEGLCGNCNNDDTDDLRLKNGETADDIFAFICSWGHYKTEQNRKECVMEFGTEEVLKPGPILEVCQQVFDNPTTFAGCHALVSYSPYVEQCSREASQAGLKDSNYKTAICNSAIEYSRRCCEHGISLQWWTNLGCNTSCPGDLIYSSCVNACPQNCDDPSADDECRKIAMDGCVCPPEHVRDGSRCIPKTQICTTPVEDCTAAPMTNSVKVFTVYASEHGKCVNENPVSEASVCMGACKSVSLFRREQEVDSSCGCCMPHKWKSVPVILKCDDGKTITRNFNQPTHCTCLPCGNISEDDRRTSLNLGRSVNLNVSYFDPTAASPDTHNEFLNFAGENPVGGDEMQDVGRDSPNGPQPELEGYPKGDVPEDILHELDSVVSSETPVEFLRVPDAV